MRVQLNVRIPEESMTMLDELCSIAGTKRPKMIDALIKSEHDKLKGNPKLKAIIEQMRILEAQLKDVTDK